MPDRDAIIADFLDRIARATGARPVRNGDQFMCRCPGHADEAPSLSVSAGRKGIVLKCFAGCEPAEVVAALGLELKDLFYHDGATGTTDRQKKPAAQRKGAPLSLVALAEAKGFTLEELRAHGVRPAGDLVEIPYLLEDGSEAPRCRLRMALKAADGSRWSGSSKDGALVPYGLWRLAEAREAGHVVLVEGETDCWSLWRAGVPALGIPGAQMVKLLEAGHLEGLESVYVVREPDQGGDAFVRNVAKRLAALGFAGRAWQVSCKPYKDPNEMMQRVGDFPRAFADALKDASPLPPSPVTPQGAAPTEPMSPRRTDTGNAQVLAQLYSERLRYDHRRSRWLVWRTHWWAVDVDGEAVRLAQEAARWRYHAAAALADPDERKAEAQWAIVSENRRRLEAALVLGQSQSSMADAGEGWDADPWLMGVGNGVLDLRTGELRAGRPEDGVTMHTDVAFDPEATCPRWEQALEQIFDGRQELIGYFQRAMGYTLTGLVHEQCWHLCVGAGANGKGVCFETLRHVMGDYAHDAGFATFELAARQQVPADVAALLGKRLVTASETNAGTRLNEARIKALTGGDTIGARELYKAPFNLKPVCKIWLAANHSPRVVDDSYGFWRRVRLIPFDHQFRGADDDKKLKAKLQREAEGIMAWAARGCLAWQREGLAPPECVATATDGYQNESNPLSGWLEESCVSDAEATSRANVLYESYLEWAESARLSQRERLNLHRWGRLMRGLCNTRRDSRGVLYVGLRLRVGPRQTTLSPGEPR